MYIYIYIYIYMLPVFLFKLVRRLRGARGNDIMLVLLCSELTGIRNMIYYNCISLFRRLRGARGNINNIYLAHVMLDIHEYIKHYVPRGVRGNIRNMCYLCVFRGESNRQNKSHGDPMNERLAVRGNIQHIDFACIAQTIYIYIYICRFCLDFCLYKYRLN